MDNLLGEGLKEFRPHTVATSVIRLPKSVSQDTWPFPFVVRIKVV